MSVAYQKLQWLDAEIRAGRTSLPEVLNFLHSHNLSRPYTVFSQAQIAAACALATPEPEPEPEVVASAAPAPEPIKARRKRARS